MQCEALALELWVWERLEGAALAFLRGVLVVLPHQERVLLALDLDYRPPTSPHPLDIAHTLQTPTSTPLRDFGLLDQLRP